MKNTIISVPQEPHFKFRLVEKLLFNCSNCNKRITSFNYGKTTHPKLQSAYENNIRSVLAPIPVGRASLSKFCCTVDLPPSLILLFYNNILENLITCSVEQANNIMKESANRLRDIIAKEELENIENDEKGNVFVKVLVTVGGTWQKCGYRSKTGVVSVILVRKGAVLDYIVKTLVCHTCMKHQQDDKTSYDYINC